MKILIATAFPTQGAGSGALVTTQAKSYVEAEHDVTIITGNNRTNFDKLEGVKYHLVPFTAETEDPEKIEGQLPFNYLMFTTHTESTANFWKVKLEDLEKYCDAYRKALAEEVKQNNPDIIHAQHNWLLSSTATEMGKPVVTTIHGTDLMGYERSKKELETVNQAIKDFMNEENTLPKSDLSKLEEIYKQESSIGNIRARIKELIKNNKIKSSKKDIVRIIELLDERKKYEFYIREAEKSARNSDKIIVISEAQKEKFVSLFPFAAKKVELLENGYDPKTFYVDENVNREETIGELKSDSTEDGKINPEYDNLILFVGKFADFKGIDSLLSAAKMYEDKLLEDDKKPLTIIVGSGALDEKLKAQADTLKLNNVHFVGRHGHEMIRKLQNLATVSLIPSRDEPFGLVVIEGTACGHPVSASNSGGIPGILNTKKEKLPNKDIIETDLGILVKALPVRPEILSDEQKDELDVITTQYLFADIEEKRNIVLEALSKFDGVNKQDLTAYFDNYEASTKALADSVVGICNGKYRFDNRKIAEYTEKNYSQEAIREKLIDLFNRAIKEHSRNR